MLALLCVPFFIRGQNFIASGLFLINFVLTNKIHVSGRCIILMQGQSIDKVLSFLKENAGKCIACLKLS